MSSFLLVKCTKIEIAYVACKDLLDKKMKSHINKGSLDKPDQMGIRVHWSVSFSPIDVH